MQHAACTVGRRPSLSLIPHARPPSTWRLKPCNFKPHEGGAPASRERQDRQQAVEGDKDWLDDGISRAEASDPGANLRAYGLIAVVKFVHAWLPSAWFCHLDKPKIEIGAVVVSCAHVERFGQRRLQECFHAQYVAAGVIW